MNPAFDITPQELVTGIVTERGIIRPPYAENMPKYYKLDVRSSAPWLIRSPTRTQFFP